MEISSGEEDMPPRSSSEVGVMPRLAIMDLAERDRCAMFYWTMLLAVQALFNVSLAPRISFGIPIGASLALEVVT